MASPQVTPMASTQVPPLETWPAEIRNRVFKYLAEDAQLILSATRVVYQQAVHYTPFCPSRLPAYINLHQAMTADFNFQLGSTCSQLRDEYLPLLLANTVIWVHAGNCDAMVVLLRLPPVYRQRIRHIATLGAATYGFDPATFALLPALESIEYNIGGLDWYPDSKQTITRQFGSVAHRSGLIQAHRDILNASHNDAEYLFLNPAGIPASIKVTVGVCFRIRLESKRAILRIRGVDPVPDRDDQECTVELLYDWRSGKLLGGMEELEKAKVLLEGRMDEDLQMDAAVFRLNTTPGMSESMRDELEWQVDDWNNREGYMYVAEERGLAWKGVVKEMDY